MRIVRSLVAQRLNREIARVQKFLREMGDTNERALRQLAFLLEARRKFRAERSLPVRVLCGEIDAMLEKLILFDPSDFLVELQVVREFERAGIKGLNEFIAKEKASVERVAHENAAMRLTKILRSLIIYFPHLIDALKVTLVPKPHAIGFGYEQEVIRAYLARVGSELVLPLPRVLSDEGPSMMHPSCVKISIAQLQQRREPVLDIAMWRENAQITLESVQSIEVLTVHREPNNDIPYPRSGYDYAPLFVPGAMMPPWRNTGSDLHIGADLAPRMPYIMWFLQSRGFTFHVWDKHYIMALPVEGGPFWRVDPRCNDRLRSAYFLVNDPRGDCIPMLFEVRSYPCDRLVGLTQFEQAERMHRESLDRRRPSREESLPEGAEFVHVNSTRGRWYEWIIVRSLSKILP